MTNMISISDYKRILVVLLIRCYICNKEVFADNVIFTLKKVCSDNKLILQCQLSDPNRVTTMRYMSIQQRNISELYEDVVIIRFITPNSSEVKWYNNTIKDISEIEGSSVIPANESKLVVQIDLESFKMMVQDSVMFRCTISGEGLADELKQNLTVRKDQIDCSSCTTDCPSSATDCSSSTTDCPSSATDCSSSATDQNNSSTGQMIQSEYANILVYIITCTTLINIFSD